MVEMAQERSFQALADQRNTTKHVYNTSVPVAVFPVVIPDAGDRDVQHIHPYPEVEVRQMSLEASDAGQQPPVKRKRGRPRKIKPDEGGQAQGQSAGGPKEAPSSTIKGSRAKKTEQTGSSTTKPPTGDQGVVQQPVGAVKKRGRPRKVTAAQTDEGTSPAVERSRAATTVGYATGYTPTSVYSTVQDASIVSAIQGAPVRILPTTTAVAAMNTIDDSSLRPTASVSVVIPSPTAEDTAKQSTRIPLSLSSLSTGEGSAAGKSFTYTLQGTTTPPLLHAEQPRVLKLLPQCIMTKSVVNVDLVDRWKEDNRTAGETSTDTRKKEPSGDEGKKGSENGEEGEEGRGRSKNEVSLAERN